MRFIHLVPAIFAITIITPIIMSDGSAAEPKPKSPAACPSSLGAPIKNFCEVTPGVLWRGAKPDPTAAAWLIEQGVRTVVNLELLHDDRNAFEQATPSGTGQHQVGYFRIRDWEPNAVIARKVLDEHVARFLAVVSAQPKPIYVHCRSGQNRTGVMVAAYRVIIEGQGDDTAVERAIQEMKGYQGHWFTADADYIRKLSPERREEIRRKAEEWKTKLKSDAQILCEKGACGISPH